MLRSLLLVGLACSACTRLGDLGDNLHGALATDARTLAPDDPAGPGPLAVKAYGVTISDWDHGFPVVVYRPAMQRGPLPAVVFLPARSAPEWQYESYGRALASRGLVVAVRGWYSFFRTDPELAEDAVVIADWLSGHGLADSQRIGVAGHSMGGKSSILAALDRDRFRAVVAIDPDENGYTHVARGPIERLKAPLLVLGMEVAYKAFRLCATPDGNYRSFFEHAPPGTIELTMRGADHVQVMDSPDELGMGICRVGTADSRWVRTSVRGATVRFFEQHLLGRGAELTEIAGSTLRIKEPLRSPPRQAVGREAAVLPGVSSARHGDQDAARTAKWPATVHTN